MTPLLTIAQVAERLGCHYQTVSLWIRQGHLDCIKLSSTTGGHVRVTEQQLQDFLDRRSGHYRARRDNRVGPRRIGG